MDGNKKIGVIGIAVIFAIIISACNVQKPGYVGLYVDDIIAVEDTFAFEVPEQSINDKTSTDSFSNHVKHLIFPDNFDLTDSLNLLKANLDSMRLVLIKLDSLQNNHQREIDTIGTKSQLSISLQRDSLLAQSKMAEHPRSQIKSESQVLDTPDTFNVEKINPQTVVRSIDSIKVMMQALIVKNDSINQLKKLPTVQQETIYKTDTVFIVKDFPKTANPVKQTGNNKAIEQELLAKDETIRQLRNELASLQKAKKTDTIYITKDYSQINPNTPNNQAFKSQEKESSDLSQEKEFVKNDTINQQADLVKPQQESIGKNDSIKNGVGKIKDVNNEGLMETDSINHLQNNNENYLISRNQTDTVFNIEKLPASKFEAVDTILITANYNMGKVEPDNDVLSEIKQISLNKSISKIVLSGHTDSSGNKIVNKRITDERLNYILSQINSLVPIDNIYLQNFGDTFASKNVVPSERRVEIRMIMKTEAK